MYSTNTCTNVVQMCVMFGHKTQKLKDNNRTFLTRLFPSLRGGKITLQYDVRTLVKSYCDSGSTRLISIW